MSLIKTSPSPRQIERMLYKRDWRWRHAHARWQAEIAAETAQLAAVVSRIGVVEFASAHKKPHRPARVAKAATPAPVMSGNLHLHAIGRRYEDEASAPR